MISYIIKALQQNDSVYVNDLGTFSLEYVSAQLSGDTILPPHNNVLFDSTTHHDEMAFTNLVCRERQCLITQGNMLISQWVEELKTALANNKSVSFEGFGTFSLNEKGKMLFDCERVNELNLEFEGLQEVNSTMPAAVGIMQEDEVIEEERLKEERAKEEEERLEAERLEAERLRLEEEERLQREAEERLRAAEEEERLREERLMAERAKEEERSKEERVKEEEEDDDDFEEEEIKTPKKRRSLWWLFVLIILIALGVVGYLFRSQFADLYQQVISKFSKQTEQEVVTESSTEDETIEAPVDEEIEQVVEETPEPVVYEPKVLKTTADGKYQYIAFETGHYYVIAGSLPNETDAEMHIRQRNLSQYSPTLVLQDGVSNIRVCIGIYDTEEEAEQFAKSINSKYWVLK